MTQLRKIKLAIRIIVAVAIVIVWLGIGELSVDVVAGLGIEWLRTTTIGTLTIGSGIIISMAVFDKLVDRVFRLIPVQVDTSDQAEDEETEEPAAE